MKKIRITESQAKKLGLINENSGEDSGLKSSSGALGPKPIRIVISGDSIIKLKDIIIKAIKRQDSDANVAYYEATGKIVGTVSEYKLESIKRDVKQIDPMLSLEKKSLVKALKENKKNVLKITKEQYNNLLNSGLIKEEAFKVNGGLSRVDKTFNKEFTKNKTKNFLTETKKLIEYLYGNTQDYPSFLNQYNLSYDDICEVLSKEGVILENEGHWKLSKALGTPEMAINTVMEKLNEMITNNRKLETENSPIDALENQIMFDVIYHNREIAILTDKEGNMFVLNHDSIPKTNVGNDEDAIERYINDNLNSFSYGNGLDDFESGKDIIKIDSNLKDDLLRLYDKDNKLVSKLSSIQEDSNLINNLLGSTEKAMTPQGETKEKTKEEVRQMARKLAKLYKKPVKFYLDKLNKKYGIEETTTAASSGSYTGPFLGSPAEAPEDPNKLEVPVVGEVTAGSGSVGAYDANALPNIGRDGEFKSNPKVPKAFKKTQYAKGGFVKFNDCVKLNNKPAGAGCSQGAVDNVVKIVQTKGNVNAPSLGEGNN
jgi:hypothetical protein